MATRLTTVLIVMTIGAACASPGGDEPSTEATVPSNPARETRNLKVRQCVEELRFWLDEIGRHYAEPSGGGYPQDAVGSVPPELQTTMFGLASDLIKLLSRRYRGLPAPPPQGQPLYREAQAACEKTYA